MPCILKFAYELTKLNTTMSLRFEDTDTVIFVKEMKISEYRAKRSTESNGSFDSDNNGVNNFFRAWRKVC